MLNSVKLKLSDIGIIIFGQPCIVLELYAQCLYDGEKKYEKKTHYKENENDITVND